MKKYVEIFAQIKPGQPLSSRRVEWSEGLTVGDALQKSGMIEEDPMLLQRQVGVFGKVVQWDDVLKYTDRLEVYAPLKIDPKEARRLRTTKNNR